MPFKRLNLAASLLCAGTAIVTCTGGCATMVNMGAFTDQRVEPIPFGGLRAHKELSRATISGLKNHQLPDGSESTRSESFAALLYVLPYQLVDVPLSLAGDLVTLPAVLTHTPETPAEDE